MTTHTLDASNQSLGRLASRIAVLLRGKDRPDYEPRILPTVQVVVEHLDRVKFTGSKMTIMKSHRYSGYPGGLLTRTLGERWAMDPTQVLREAVRGMLPPNRQRDRLLQNIVVEKKSSNHGN